VKKLIDGDLDSFALDENNIVICVQNNKFVIDYSLLIDFLTNLAGTASTAENQQNIVSLNETLH
jgi:hypothetical protein